MKYFHCPKCRVVQGYDGHFYLKQISEGKAPNCDYCDDKMIPGKLPEMDKQ